MRSGWKRSSCSMRSPVDAYRIGLPVTALTESAAPPRASPSSLVSTTPSNSTRSAKLSATLTASWPVIASSTSSTSCGLVRLRIAASSSISSLVDVQAPGGVDDQHVEARRSAPGRAPTRRCRPGRARCPARRPSRRSACPSSPAARPPPGAACRRRRARPSCRRRRGAWRASRRRSSCPSPGGPAIRITVVPEEAKARSRLAPPISAASSSSTILTTCWPGSSESSTPAPRQRSLTCAVNCLTTLKLTSASSSARRISRIALSTSASVSLPRERTSDERLLEAV